MSEDELNALASSLRGLKPSAGPLDRDALMYRAGRASAPRQTWLWPAATAATALLAVGLAFALWSRTPITVDHYVNVPTPMLPVGPPVEAPIPTEIPPVAAPVAAPWEPPTSEYEKVRDNVLRWGLDGLPPAPRTPHAVVSAKDIDTPVLIS